MQEALKNARWLTCPQTPKGAATAYYKSVCFDRKVKWAKLYASAVGVYEAYINGVKVDDTLLKPGYTSYHNRIQYQTFTVQELQGQTEICIQVAPGWAVGRAIFLKDKSEQLFSDHTAVIAALVGEYEDGTAFAYATDESWLARSCEVLFSDIYDGETADYTAPITQYGHAVVSPERINLVAQVGDGVAEQERLAPVSIFETPKGERVIDFGQNMTGVVEFVIAGKAGDRISYTCAEVLDKDGNFYNDNYRTAKNRVTYVLDGTQRVLKPKFSFQGFRYIRLEEYPADFFETVQSITAVVWHTKLQRTGHFRCGNPKVNQLYHNIIWGQKGNYLDVPTDCPQRDERLGWTGDAQVFCRTAAYNFDVRNFFRKWLGDLRLEQLKNGAILGICPHLPEKSAIRISAGWGDCVTIIPWELYKVYGDPGFLAENFEMMVRWVEYIRATGDNEYLWLTGYHYGDWLAMEEGMEDSYVGATANDLVATAFYAYSVSLLVRSGHILGKDMAEYEQLLQNIKKEFRTYFMPQGDLLDEYPLTELFQPGRKVIDIVRKGRTQTALTLILKFGLCEDKDKPRFAKMLDEMVEKNGGRMTTGFLGTPYILQALTENGYAGRAYDLFFQEENPSWLYSVNHGATTMWEHWNSLKEDGSFWSTNMNSFNHYAYGAVGAWMYETVAGIQMAETAAGFEKLVLAPIPDARLGFVECAIDTVRGTVESSWVFEGDAVRFSFTVPEGVEARICLPDGQESCVTGGHYEFTVKKDALRR